MILEMPLWRRLAEGDPIAGSAGWPMISDSMLGLNTPLGLLKEWGVIAQTLSTSLRTNGSVQRQLWREPLKGELLGTSRLFSRAQNPDFCYHPCAVTRTKSHEGLTRNGVCNGFLE